MHSILIEITCPQVVGQHEQVWITLKQNFVFMGVVADNVGVGGVEWTWSKVL